MAKEKFRSSESTPEYSEQSIVQKISRWFTPAREVQKAPTSERYPFHEITQKEKENIYDHLYSEGSYRAYEITPNSLEFHGVSPEYFTELEGRKFAFSNPFYIDRSRCATIGFVEDDQHNYVARPFYRSDSQGLWRLMPDFYSVRGNDIKHIGKGWLGQMEDSLNLPIELQNVLQNIDAKTETLNFDQERLQIFMSTSHQRRDKNVDDRNNPANSYYAEIKSMEDIPYSDGKQHSHLYEYISPETLSINGASAPNFEKKYMSYETKTPLYGDVTVDCFKSYDDQKKYIFYRDQNNRACLTNIETNAPLTSLGVRSKWVEGDRFTMPLYEYETNLKYYAFDRIFDIEHDFPRHPSSRANYRSMFESYLSKAPIIQDYLQSQGIDPSKSA